VSAKAGHK